MSLYFVDIEASSLEPTSFPIEIAWVDQNGQHESYLIRPEPNWTDWSQRSEAIHGISLETLMKHGKQASFVARRVQRALTGHTLVSDNPGFDSQWLSTLLGVIWNQKDLQIVDFLTIAEQEIRQLCSIIDAEVGSKEWHIKSQQLLREGISQVVKIMQKETLDQLMMHRALPDAQRLWRCWQSVKKEVKF